MTACALVTCCDVLSGGYFAGDAGDSLMYHDGMRFSTRGYDNDRRVNGSCVEDMGCGGFWLNDCNTVGINDHYSNHSDGHGPGHERDVMSWSLWRGATYSLKATLMLIKPQT